MTFASRACVIIVACMSVLFIIDVNIAVYMEADFTIGNCLGRQMSKSAIQSLHQEAKE